MSGLALAGMALAIGLSEGAWLWACAVSAALLLVLPALKTVRDGVSGTRRLVLDVLDQVLWVAGALTLVVLVVSPPAALLVAALFVSASLVELSSRLSVSPST